MPSRTYPRFPVRRGLLLAGLLLWTAAAEAQFGGLCPGEIERARGVFQRIQREWPLRGSADPVTLYLNALGGSMGRRSEPTGQVRWSFSVVRNLSPNAFSIGAGVVFVTEGAVAFARNESEIAAILAHEIGHELAGHFCRPGRRSESGGLFDIFSAPAAPREDRIGVGSLTQVIDLAKEQEADRIALSVLRAAGYDPRAMLEVTRRLAGGKGLHAEDPRRVQALERLLGPGVPQPPADSDKFREIKNLLAQEGFAR